MSSIKSGYEAKFFVESHLITNKWYRENVFVTDLCNVFNKVTIVVYKTF